jgi:hypothetical protein
MYHWSVLRGVAEAPEFIANRAIAAPAHNLNVRIETIPL